MTSKKTFITSAIILILLFAVSIASAAIEVNTYVPSKDFNVVSSYDKISVCSCSTKYDTISVTNTGTWPAIYTITVSESDSTILFSENSFELLSGQSKDVFMYITSECSKGTEDILITVSSNLGIEKYLEKTIVRDRCQNIESWITNNTNVVSPCESKDIEITVKNVGPFADTYTIQSNYDKYITYNTKSFNLDEGKHTKVIATAKFDCNMYGTKDIIFTINSQKNKLTANLNTQLNIMQEYDYTFYIGKPLEDKSDSTNIEVCNRASSTKIPIYIKNTGAVANNYEVKFSNLPKNSRVAELIDGKFSLNPQESKTFYIDVDSTNYRYEHKFKDINVEIIPEFGDIIKKESAVIEFKSCYEHQIVVYDYGNTKNRPLRTCADYEYSYDLDITNNGAFKEKYSLSLEGAPSTITLSKTEVEVGAGQKTSVKLLITGPKTNEIYDIKIIVKSSKGIVETDNVWINSYDTQTCHNTIIGDKKYNINYQDTQIIIPVQNKGLVDNTYLVLVDGIRFVKVEKALLNINQSNKNDIIINLDTADIKEGTYTGTVTLGEASGARYSKEITIVLKDKTLFRKAIEYFLFGNMCRQVSIYQVLAIILVIILTIVFLIKGPNYPYNFKNRMKTKIPVMILLLMIFIVITALTIIVVGLPKTHTEIYNLTTSDSELTYEWLENTKYKLDVNKFFYDPENRTLTYSVEGLKHIDTSIRGSIITFYPESGWHGTDTGNIIATDDMGGSVKSPKVTLTIIDVPKKSNIELYNIYCWYANLLIFLVLLIFIFIAVFIKQKRRTRK